MLPAALGSTVLTWADAVDAANTAIRIIPIVLPIIRRPLSNLRHDSRASAFPAMNGEAR
jgi:hypothetical protein